MEKHVQIIKSQTNIPICVGFGIKTPDDAKSVSAVADGVVVGSSIVELIEKKNTTQSNFRLYQVASRCGS